MLHDYCTCRRKFSLTSDNMESWKAEHSRRVSRWSAQKRSQVSRKKMHWREMCCVFSMILVSAILVSSAGLWPAGFPFPAFLPMQVLHHRCGYEPILDILVPLSRTLHWVFHFVSLGVLWMDGVYVLYLNYQLDLTRCAQWLYVQCMRATFYWCRHCL